MYPRHVRSASATVLLLLLLLGCAPAAAPCPAFPAAAPAPAALSASAAAAIPAPAGPEADVVLLLRPALSPKPLVHVELTLSRSDANTAVFTLASGAPDHVARAGARDASGAIAVDVSPAGPGVALRLARAPSGPLTLAYDVLAGDDAPDDPLGLLVLDDRFRGAGERLVALPEAVASARAEVLVRLDGDALRAAGVASSLGVGKARKATVPVRALRYASYVAGSLGVQVSDDGAAHDEGAWLGSTAFDARPSMAELAVYRTALRDLFKARFDMPPWTTLLLTQTRPLGSFTTTPRFQSTLLQVGPGEPWSAALRLSMAQQLARFWIGGLLRVATEPGHEAEGAWFGEGVSRYAAMLMLTRADGITMADARDAVGGELSVLATSPHRALGNARLAELARTDPAARATLMARGALYALREAAVIRARSGGQRGLATVLQGLLRQLEERKTAAAFPLSAWLDAVGADDPDAARTFDALVVRGEAVTLPSDALGPCFRAGTGDYVSYDPGFDVEATRLSPDGKVVGVRAGGPADRAGLREGDVIESMTGRDGDANAPVKLVATRAGARVTVTYAPRGARGRGQTWARVADVPDGRCGDLP